ncbi:Poly [ADP-ribose] polymerase 6 [Oryzias melastigma]|uniref:Poly [ADP-ribose] polymerase n=1 Tax=Oryzias melastigma TaxID=30732 RepID=A0A834F3D2_ORYME|nr:Poly [ADP-ribose] polymerase 6 [Oryzias melastigma]
MDAKQWTDSYTDEGSNDDSDSDDFLCGIQQWSCATDLNRHPQLDKDLRDVTTLYSDAAVAVREYESIDGVDVDLKIKTSCLTEQVATAWAVSPLEPVVVRLHFSLSQYLDGPAPSVEVFQPSNAAHFSVGRQLQNILTVFINQEWKHLKNDNIVVWQKRRHSWFRPSGTIKKFRARLSIWLPLSKSSKTDDPTVKGKINLTAMKRHRLVNHSTSYTIKNPAGEFFTYTSSGKRVMVSAVRSSAHLSTKQLVELLFSSQAIGQCKSAPPLQHGFLAQIMRYAEQRLPTLNEYCVICDERHVFQNGPMLKPAVCSRELCVFSFHMLGVMSGADEVATGAEVIDLLVAMCRAALQSSRKSIIFEPYPSVVDPNNPKTLAFSPKRKSYDRLQRALNGILLIRTMAQGSYSETKKQMDKIDPLAHPLLQWILASNRSHIVKLPLNKQLKFMHTPHQFLLISSPPSKEARFQTARKLYGSTFAFHGSHIENWHSILRKGLVNASYTKFQLHGAAYGRGIYLSPISSISFGYSDMGKGQHQMQTKTELLKKYNGINTFKKEHLGQTRFLQSCNLNCVALCEVITSKDLQKHGNIWVCPVSDHVCTRFLFVWGTANSHPIPGLTPNTLHMRVKQGSKIHNLLRIVTARFQGDRDNNRIRQVVFTGSGRGITKTITCVEILKRSVAGLHQLSKVYYKRANQDSQRETPSQVLEKRIPAIWILLSKDPLDPLEPGYQAPQRAPPESSGGLLPAGPSPKHKRLCLDGQIESHL